MDLAYFYYMLSVFEYFGISLIKNGRGEVRPYSIDETDRSARTGGLEHPPNVKIKALYF